MKRMEWLNLLDRANDDIRPYGVQIDVDADDDGFYSVSIEHADDAEDYASGCFENEVSGIVNEAWRYVRDGIRRRLY